MEKIKSFTIDHTRLWSGVYVSRKDTLGLETITTFDLRIATPNRMPAMGPDAIHAMEHLAATYLRNDPVWKDSVIYFGPMGCRTGFYLIMKGNLQPGSIVPLLVRCFTFISKYEGNIPGATAKECGNYLEMNLNMAKYWANRYLTTLEYIDESRMNYPK